MTEVAIYCRHVPARPGSKSLAAQLLRCLKFMSARSWNVVAVYTDIVSDPMPTRPGLEQLLADAEAGKFEVIIAGLDGGITYLPVESDRISTIRHNIEACEAPLSQDAWLRAILTTSSLRKR